MLHRGLGNRADHRCGGKRWARADRDRRGHRRRRLGRARRAGPRGRARRRGACWAARGSSTSSPGRPRPTPARGRRRCCPPCPGCFAELADRRVCVLASGDPMFHGIGATLVRVLGPDRLHVRAAPLVGVAGLRAAGLGRSTGVEVVSAVARPLARVRRVLAPGARLLVLSEDATTPGALAALLVDAGYGAIGADRARPARRARTSDARAGHGGRLGAPAGRPAERRRRRRASPTPMRRSAPRCRACPTTPTTTTGSSPSARSAPSRSPSSARGPGSCCGTSARATGRSRSSGCGPTARAGRSPSRATTARAGRIATNAEALGVPSLQVVRGRAPEALAGLPDAGRRLHRWRRHDPGRARRLLGRAASGRPAGGERRHAGGRGRARRRSCRATAVT